MLSRMVLVIGLGLAATAAASCVVSPQPSPPEAILQGDLIGLRPGVELAATVVGFEAGPGAVQPPRGVVVVTNLNGADPPSFADVQPDGSFSIAVPGQPGQTFRFQAKDGPTRSEPVDIEVGSSGATTDSALTSLPCLVIEPSAWLSLTGVGETGAIVLRNECASTVVLNPPHLRRGLAGFTFSSVPSVGIAAGGSFAVTVHAGAGSEAEDVLILEVTSPATTIRAVTLTVADR